MTSPKSNNLTSRQAWGAFGIAAILLTIFCIAQFGSCDSPQSPAFGAGYQLGLAAGKIDGGSGRASPTQSQLDLAAQGALKGSAYEKASSDDQEKYRDGFKAGYEVGFKQSSKPAF